jgi:molecular chaperone DnaK (HSP70)
MSIRQIPCAIGIDIGTNRFVISAIKNGGVDILTNNANYRQTPNLVTYGNLRSVGENALANVKQNLKNSVFGV